MLRKSKQNKFLWQNRVILIIYSCFNLSLVFKNTFWFNETNIFVVNCLRWKCKLQNLFCGAPYFQWKCKKMVSTALEVERCYHYSSKQCIQQRLVYKMPRQMAKRQSPLRQNSLTVAPLTFLANCQLAWCHSAGCHSITTLLAVKLSVTAGNPY